MARNTADWYRLIDLCGLSNTLIGDADGLYHPALFNDRLLLGFEGHDERGGTLRPARQAQRWHPQ